MSSGVDSEGDEIEFITLDRSGRHIGQIVAAAMRAVRQQEAEEFNLLAIRASPHKLAPKSRGCNGTSVHKNLLSSGDHPRDRENG